MASMTNVCVNPLNFALASLAPLSFVRSATVLIPISHSSNLVESYSLKTAMSCSNELVRFLCFCVVHKVFVYWCITSPKGSVGVGVGGGWSTIERFCSSCYMCSKLCWLSFSSLYSLMYVIYLPHECCQFILIAVYRASRVNFCLWSPKATAVSEPWVLSSLLSMHMASSTWRSMSLSKEHPAPLWWVAIVCVIYVVQYPWYLSLIFPSTVLNSECVLVLQLADMCRVI